MPKAKTSKTKKTPKAKPKHKKLKIKPGKEVKPRCTGQTYSVKFGWWKDTPQNFSCINHTARFALSRARRVQVRLGQNVTFVQIEMMTLLGRWVVVLQGKTNAKVPLNPGQYRANCARRYDKSAISYISWKL
jgi:hypothetical protein